MNFVLMTQHIKQTHDALQSYANVGLAVYAQFLWTLPQRLEAMIYTEICKIQSRGNVVDIYEMRRNPFFMSQWAKR